MRKALFASLLLVTSSVSAMELQTLGESASRMSIDSVLQPDAWTIVMIWSLDCVVCEKQKPMINQFHTDHAQGHAQVIGIASDGDESMHKLVEHMVGSPTEFNNYVPDTDSFYDDFLAITGKEFKGTPTYMIFKPNGSLAGVHSGTLHRKQLDQIIGSAGN